MLTVTITGDRVDWPGLLRKMGRPGMADTVEKMSPATQGTLAGGAARFLEEPLRQALQKTLDARKTGLRLTSVTAETLGQDRGTLRLRAHLTDLNAAVLLQAFLPELMNAAERREKLRFLPEFYHGDEAEVRRALWMGLDALSQERQEVLAAGMITSLGDAVGAMLERTLQKQGISLRVLSVTARA